MSGTTILFYAIGVFLYLRIGSSIGRLGVHIWNTYAIKRITIGSMSRWDRFLFFCLFPVSNKFMKEDPTFHPNTALIDLLTESHGRMLDNRYILVICLVWPLKFLWLVGFYLFLACIFLGKYLLLTPLIPLKKDVQVIEPISQNAAPPESLPPPRPRIDVLRLEKEELLKRQAEEQRTLDEQISTEEAAMAAEVGANVFRTPHSDAFPSHADERE